MLALTPTIAGNVVRFIKSVPSLQAIADVWNVNVDYRARELESGKDNTYFKVIIPHIRELLSQHAHQGSRVLDIGCGLGHLTNMIASWKYDVQGIDIADRAMAYARRKFKKIPFERTSIVDFALCHQNQFDICIANMVLHNLGDIENNLSAIHSLLKPHGKVIASIPHPKTWLTKHYEMDLFDYSLFKIYEVPFRIRGGDTHPAPFIYFHRPIELYVELLKSSKFTVLDSSPPKSINNQLEDDLLFCVWQKH